MTKTAFSEKSDIKIEKLIQSQNIERVYLNESESVVHEFNDMNIDESLNELELPDSIVRKYNGANQNKNFSDQVEKVSLKKSESMISKYNINDPGKKDYYKFDSNNVSLEIFKYLNESEPINIKCCDNNINSVMS